MFEKRKKFLASRMLSSQKGKSWARNVSPDVLVFYLQGAVAFSSKALPRPVDDCRPPTMASHFWHCASHASPHSTSERSEHRWAHGWADGKLFAFAPVVTWAGGEAAAGVAALLPLRPLQSPGPLQGMPVTGSFLGETFKIGTSQQQSFQSIDHIKILPFHSATSAEGGV